MTNSCHARFTSSVAILLAGLWTGTAHADAVLESHRQQGALIRAVTPVFSQLVTFSIPPSFSPAFENVNNGQYTQEMVPQGESVNNWSQMITLTGAKGLSANQNLTPQKFASLMAEGFKKACPTTFAAAGLGDVKISGFDAFGAVITCGTTTAGGPPHSEHLLVMVVKGQTDYYTLQWAERAAASASPIPFDETKWMSRFKAISPIGLCPIITGEKPPYPSCVDRK